jgi:catechol 2,3-dioxygenase-like lactoylglutathione lyase family enzyme
MRERADACQAERDGAPARLAVMSLHLFAGLRVRDFQAARPWYERLLGEVTFLPHDSEAVWTLADDRSVYVVEHPEGAGNSVVTIFVEDLDGQVAAIAGRGLEPDESETYDNGVRKILYRDPDGNELGFAGAPLDGGS